MHYLDHSANSWPKPLAVYQALDLGLASLAAQSPASAHGTGTDQAQSIREAAQAELAALFNLLSPTQVYFTTGCSQALQQAFDCLPWQPGDGIVISALEHQSLLGPVLRLARTRGVQLYIVPYAEGNPFSLSECEALLKAYPDIRLIATPHASNVIGCMLPIRDIGHLARRYGKHYLVDAAQTAGLRPIDMQGDCIDLLALPGHKFLNGPRGTGALVMGEAFSQASGSQASGKVAFRKGDRQSSPGKLFAQEAVISGAQLLALTEGVRWVRSLRLPVIQRQSTELLAHLQDGLEAIPEVTVYGLSDISRHSSALSFNVLNHHPEVLAQQLFQDFGILVRAGLHNSRLSHEAIGTLHRGGTLRASLGFTTRPEDIEALIEALKQILVDSSSSRGWVAGRLNNL